MNAELLARIQEEASLGGLSHIFPPELYPFPTEAVQERWQAFAGPVRLAGEDGFVAVAPPFLEAIYVRPSAWGTGVAGALHDWAVEQLRAAGVERARLWVLEENHRARRFYERRGWLLDGTTREVPFPPNPIDLGYALALG